MYKIVVCFCFFCFSADANYLEIVKKHCYECHSGEKLEAALDLSIFESQKAFYIHFDTLVDFYEQVKSGDMPPEDESKMSDGERTIVVDHLGKIIHKLETTAANITGSTKIRRLTNYEYDNTVEAVTGLDLNLARNFPADGGGGEGFGNDSAILGVSPLQFERYMDAAEQISNFSRFDMKKGFIFSSSVYTPKTRSEIVNEIDREVSSLFVDLYPKNFSIKRYLPKLMIAVNEFNLNRSNKNKLPEIAAKVGLNYLILLKGIKYFSTTSGKGIIERDAIRPWFGLSREKFDVKKASEYAKAFTENYEDALAQIDKVATIKRRSYLDFKNNIKAIFTFSDQELFRLVKKEKLARYQELKKTQEFLRNGMRSKYLKEVAVPLMTHVRTLLTKAHRKPPSDNAVKEMTKDMIEATAKFGLDVAAQMFVIRTFAHMKFIYRHEEKVGRPTKITDYELANRLSYFIWGGPPDEELMKLASEKQLSDPKVLKRQVKKMLKKRQSSSLAKYFAAQWLHFGEILEVQGPNREKFPEFDEDLAKDMWKESALCFEYIVKSDRSVLEIIDADYTFANNRLSKIYGLDKGSRKFSKVSLKDSVRGGITGHASVLTLTSGSLRTSPIYRGNWVLSSLLGTPTPPAPANVEPLPDEEVVSKNLTLKKQLESHRNLRQCKGCHQKIDPLGFPLENFAPIGRWRDKYEKAPIDAVGETLTEKTIDGPLGLKKYLLRNKEVFLKNMSRKLLSYALGRSIEYYDFYVINEMTRELKENNYQFSSMVWKVVNSYQFQHKN